MSGLEKALFNLKVRLLLSLSPFLAFPSFPSPPSPVPIPVPVPNTPTLPVHIEIPHATSGQGGQRREDGAREAQEGRDGGPRGHCTHLRAERDPEAERAPQPPAARQPHRCRREQGPDGRHDARGDGEHGGGREGHGGSAERDGFGEG